MSHATEQMAVKRWEGHSDQWPDGYRKCMKCDVLKSQNNFHKHAMCKGGFNSVCKECRKPFSKQQNANRTIQRRLYDSAKSRATQKQREFNIELEDIVIPTLCPVFLTPIDAPSIDRIDSSKGYIKGNIRVISRRANILKNNASVCEMQLVLADLIRLQAGVCEIL